MYVEWFLQFQTLLALKECLDEANAREANLSRKLSDSRDMLDRLKAEIADRWDQSVDEEILLAKIEMLQEEIGEERRRKGNDNEAEEERWELVKCYS